METEGAGRVWLVDVAQRGVITLSQLQLESAVKHILEEFSCFFLICIQRVNNTFPF